MRGPPLELEDEEFDEDDELEEDEEEELDDEELDDDELDELDEDELLEEDAPPDDPFVPPHAESTKLNPVKPSTFKQFDDDLFSEKFGNMI